MDHFMCQQGWVVGPGVWSDIILAVSVTVCLGEADFFF